MDLYRGADDRVRDVFVGHCGAAIRTEFTTEDTEGTEKGGENLADITVMLWRLLRVCQKRRVECRRFLRASRRLLPPHRCGASCFPFLARLCARQRVAARLRHWIGPLAMRVAAWIAARAPIHRSSRFQLDLPCL